MEIYTEKQQPSMASESKQLNALTHAMSNLTIMSDEQDCQETIIHYADWDGNLLEPPTCMAKQPTITSSGSVNVQECPHYYNEYIKKVFNSTVKVASGDMQDSIEIAKLVADMIDVSCKAQLAIMYRIFVERSVIKRNTKLTSFVRALAALKILDISSDVEVYTYANAMSKKINGGKKNGMIMQNLGVNHINWENKNDYDLAKEIDKRIMMGI